MPYGQKLFEFYKVACGVQRDQNPFENQNILCPGILFRHRQTRGCYKLLAGSRSKEAML